MAETMLHRPIRAALYGRISTVNHGQDVSMQTRELRDYCERRGWQIAGEYMDAGISGAKDRRPELDRLMADAHRRRFDVVAVWKFDRFARSVSHLLRARHFPGSRNRVCKSVESLDTATPAGRMVFTVLGAVAELERSLIMDLGASEPLTLRLRVSESGPDALHVDSLRIATLRHAGRSWSAIAQDTGWTKGTQCNERAFYAQTPSLRLPKNV